MNNAHQGIPEAHYAETPYGFEFGCASITRIHHVLDGAVWIGLETPKHPSGRGINIHITKTGKVRIYDSRGEWTAPSGKAT